MAAQLKTIFRTTGLTVEIRGHTGWLLTGAVVAVVDTFGVETMSESFRQARESESKLVRAAAVGGLVLTVLHLMDYIPTRLDVFDIAVNALHKLRDHG